jgi:uncharacterized membrane protein
MEARVTDAWWMVAIVGVATIAIKAAGPVLLGGRPLPPRIARIIGLLAPALLAALVATSTFAAGQSLVLDERALGVGGVQGTPARGRDRCRGRHRRRESGRVGR